MIAGAGAIVALLANLDDIRKSEAAKNHWWLLPVAVLAIGYVLRKRGNPYGTAVLAVGGALFALGYQVYSAKQAAAANAPKIDPNNPYETKGPFYGDTGALGPPVTAQVLPMGAGPGHVWVQMPNGQIARVSLLGALNAALKKSALHQRPVPTTTAA